MNTASKEYQIFSVIIPNQIDGMASADKLQLADCLFWKFRLTSILYGDLGIGDKLILGSVDFE